MDLTQELVAALDNPEEVWGSLIEGFEPETRTALLLLATHKTPVELPDWQASIARVDVKASTRFEAALRTLDDLFVSTRRIGHRHAVDFRNPSMDDFCVDYIDRNVGIVVEVARRDPSLQQVVRLVALATASDAKGNRSYPNLSTALIAEPGVLLDRLVALRGDDERVALSAIADVLATLQSATIARYTKAAECLRDGLAAVDFATGQRLIYALLDQRRRARLIRRIMGADFEEYYARLWRSARALDDFDTLVNVDVALDRDGADAPWAERFEGLFDSWIESVSSLDDASSMRETYEKVVDYLGDGDGRLDEWDTLIDEWPREPGEEGEEEYAPTYRPDSRGGSGGRSAIADELERAQNETRMIDAMFDGLTGRED